MDDIVKAALAKWPNVPHCHGWLGLDARGSWFLRDLATQAAGDFPAAKGSLIEHLRLREFIERNYAADADGRWYFQNGPQRVYVELEAAPWVWRLNRLPGAADGPAIVGHTGREARFESAWVDDEGRLFLATDIGVGIVHSLDMELASQAVEEGRWQPRQIAAQELARRFGFVPSPLGEAAGAARQAT